MNARLSNCGKLLKIFTTHILKTLYTSKNVNTKKDNPQPSSYLLTIFAHRNRFILIMTPATI